jgi:hypothetical protein
LAGRIRCIEPSPLIIFFSTLGVRAPFSHL